MILISFLNKLNSLSLNGAKVFFDGVDIVNSSGVPVGMPYVNVEDQGATPDYEFELNGEEVRKIVVHCYSTKLADVVALANSIMYNGGTPQDALGMDHGTLADSPPQRFMSCTRTFGKFSKESGMDSGTKFVHKCEIHYDVKTSVGASS